MPFVEGTPTLDHVPDEILLFAYGSLLRGELHGDVLVDAVRLGRARTVPGYRLVELDRFPALIASGTMQVDGELYVLGRDLLRKVDELKENGRLFFRRQILLESGSTAQTYLMDEDKLRGRRRLSSGDWRRRFEPTGPRLGRRDPFRGIR